MKYVILFSIFSVSLLLYSATYGFRTKTKEGSVHYYVQGKLDEIQLEETFLSLDSVWTPGVKQKFSLHPFDNYLWIKNGMATFFVDEVRGKSFRGPASGVSVEEKSGKRVTTFTVRSAKMKIEITEVGDNRFEIFTYNYLEKYERMFSAFWVDPSKVTFSED